MCEAASSRFKETPIKIACDMCQQAVDDALLQIVEEGNEILYVCPECYVQTMGEPPEEQP